MLLRKRCHLEHQVQLDGPQLQIDELLQQMEEPLPQMEELQFFEVNEAKLIRYLQQCNGYIQLTLIIWNLQLERAGFFTSSYVLYYNLIYNVEKYNFAPFALEMQSVFCDLELKIKKRSIPINL